MNIEAFSPTPPDWINTATHARHFCCPHCRETPRKAQKVWINRRSPVISEDYRRKWQEFYQCECGQGWWGWSRDRSRSASNSYNCRYSCQRRLFVPSFH